MAFSSTRIEDYVVAYIDLLGQRDAYNKCAERPLQSDTARHEEFLSAITKVAASIATTQDRFEHAAKAIAAKHSEVLGITTAPLGVQWFSDGLSIFSPLPESDPTLAVSLIWTVMHCCADITVSNLAMEFPIRCGIAVGVGFSLRGTDIYGPVLARAYEAEAHLATYPRIVLDESVCVYFRSATERQSSEDSRWRRSPFELFRELAGVDFDGLPYVDYAGSGAVQLILSDKQKASFSTAHANARAGFLNARDSRVRAKYGYLARYLSAWKATTQ